MVKQAVKRMSRQARYDELIQATYACVAENGLDGTTVRDVADYAGVTFGLIRHYFASKDELIAATYSAITAEMTNHAREAAAAAGPEPRDKLRAFIEANLSGTLVSERYLSFWSCFIGRILADPEIQKLHQEGFWEYRAELTELVKQTCRQAGVKLSASELRLTVIKVSAIIDGLWIEAGLEVKDVEEATLIKAGIDSVSAILSVELTR